MPRGLILVALLTSACATTRGTPAAGPGATAAPAAKPAPAEADLRTVVAAEDDAPPSPPPGADAEHPLLRCGASDSYHAVREYRCEDGAAPLLRAPPGASKAARRGNLGSNRQGHIIDHYVVPCAGRPVDLYVDMYSCTEERSMALMALSMGAPDPAASLQAQLTEGLAALRRGSVDEADTLLSQTRDRLVRMGAPGRSSLAEALWALGQVRARQQRDDEAVRLLQQAAEMLEQLGGPYEERLGVCLTTLARLHQGRSPQRALPLLRRALHIAERRGGLRHPDVTQALLELGKFYQYIGEKARAEAVRRRARAAEAAPETARVPPRERAAGRRG